jgi:hypothetical protein
MSTRPFFQKKNKKRRAAERGNLADRQFGGAKTTLATASATIKNEAPNVPETAAAERWSRAKTRRIKCGHHDADKSDNPRQRNRPEIISDVRTEPLILFFRREHQMFGRILPEHSD